jgi:hypothetical protein
VPRKNEPTVVPQNTSHLTLPEAAALLGTTPWAVAHRIRRGKIPAWVWTKEPTGLRRILLIREALTAHMGQAKASGGVR